MPRTLDSLLGADANKEGQHLLAASLQSVFQEVGPRQAEILHRCAIPRWWDVQILAVLRERPDHNQQVLELLRQYSFVRQFDEEHYTYHEAVRALLLKEWREQRPRELYAIHTRLIKYFTTKYTSTRSTASSVAPFEDMRRHWFHEMLYHAIVAATYEGAQFEIAFRAAVQADDIAEAEALIQIISDARFDLTIDLPIQHYWDRLAQLAQRHSLQKHKYQDGKESKLDLDRSEGGVRIERTVTKSSRRRSGSRSSDILSNRQKDILAYIEDFISRRGFPPSVRQIQETLGISSSSVVIYDLNKLHAKGLIKREGKVARGISIPLIAPPQLSRQNFTQVPLLGVITAGMPLPNPQEIEAEMVNVPVEIASGEKLQDVYALKVRGHSMIDALIDDGDIVLIRYQETAEDGQMIVARIEDDDAVTLKKYYKEAGRVRLQPANVTMDAIYVDAANVRIQGRVVGVIRSLSD
jgi:repressor LexA